jgi:hypothetical protein
MSAPKKVILGPFAYKVIVDESRVKQLEEHENSELFAMTLLDSLEIVLHPSSAPMVQREKLLHELLHVVFDNTGISNRFSDRTEEQLVRALSPALFDLLRENPELVRYLTEGADEQ